MNNGINKCSSYKRISAAVKFFVFSFIFLQLLNSAKGPGDDDGVLIAIASNIISGKGIRGDFGVDWFYQYARNPLFSCLFLSPFLYISYLLTGIADFTATLAPSVWTIVKMSCAVLGALTIIVFRKLLLHLDFSARRASIWAFFLIISTTAWTYYRILFTENIQMSLITVCLLLSYRIGKKQNKKWERFALYIILIALINTKISAGWMFGVSWILSCRLKDTKSIVKEGVSFCLTAIVGLSLFLYSNYLKCGQWSYVGYGGTYGGIERFGFSTPWWIGVFGLLLSPGKGLFWFTPLSILFFWGIQYLWKKDTVLTIAIIGGILFHLSFHAMWWAWAGAWSWGPRYLVPILPLIMLPVFFKLENMLNTGWRKFPAWFAAVLISLSIFVQILSVIIPNWYYMAIARNVTQKIFPGNYNYGPVCRDDDLLTHWIPEFSSIRGHLWLLKLAFINQKVHKSIPPWKSLDHPVVQNPDWKSINSIIKYKVPRIDWWLTDVFLIHRAKYPIILFNLFVFAGIIILCNKKASWNKDETI